MQPTNKVEKNFSTQPAENFYAECTTMDTQLIEHIRITTMSITMQIFEKIGSTNRR